MLGFSVLFIPSNTEPSSFVFKIRMTSLTLCMWGHRVGLILDHDEEANFARHSSFQYAWFMIWKSNTTDSMVKKNV